MSSCHAFYRNYLKKKFYYDYYIIYATAAAVGLSVSVLLLENSSSSYLGCCYGFLWF